MRSNLGKLACSTAFAAAAIWPSSGVAQDRPAAAVDPAVMRAVGAVDERYQSYNVEMLEVTGGKFWKPYSEIPNGATQPKGGSDGASGAAAGGTDVPAGMSPDLYQDRPPLDLANPRLRAMAKALGPAYVRISGTWANTTYFADTDTPPKEPPSGYGGVLTRQQWLGAIDFSKAVNAPIVTSLPNGEGTRGSDGVWTPEQSDRWLGFTKAHGGTVAAVEFFNEPTLATMGGASAAYDATAFGRDYRVFNDFMRAKFPDTKLLAPGSVGETIGDWGVAQGGYGDMKVLHAEDLAKHTGDADAFSYHHYGAVSQRCAAMGHQTTADEALSEDWLARTDGTLAYYRAVRDTFMPGKPFWNTETADAACGGNPWAGTFLDTFRYLDQLGRLARQDVAVVMHNTLVASDYGLLDENTFEPKPNYWGALLWRKLMGTTVLDPGVAGGTGLHVYAHCSRHRPGAVAMLVINPDRNAERSLRLPTAATRYALTASSLMGRSVDLNGKPLQPGADDALPALGGEPVPAGSVTFAPASITFLELPDAQNPACR